MDTKGDIMLEFIGENVDSVFFNLCGNKPDYGLIEEVYGSKVRRRVELINRYWGMVERKEVREPLLPVFGGMPSVGKTTTSSIIARSLGINVVIGGDGFRAVLRALVSKEDNPAFFVSVYKAWQVFGEFNKDNVVKGFRAQADILNKAIERLIVDRGIRDGESMSVDFLHFLPSLWHNETLEHPSFMPFVLYVSDTNVWKKYIEKRVVRNHIKGGWKRLIEALDSYRIMMEYQIDDAKKHNIPVIDMINIEEAYGKIYDILYEKINKLIEIKVWDKEHPMINKIKKERGDKK